MKKHFIVIAIVLVSFFCSACSAPGWLLPDAKVSNSVMSAKLSTNEAAASLPDDVDKAAVVAALAYVASMSSTDDDLSLGELKDFVLLVLANSPTYTDKIADVRIFLDQFLAASEQYIETQSSWFKVDDVQLTTILAAMIQSLQAG